MNVSNVDMLTLIETACTCVERSLQDFVAKLGDDNAKTLTAELAGEVSAGLQKALQEAGREAFQQFLQGHEDGLEAQEMIDGRAHRRGTWERKRFLTRFGEISLTRGLYYPLRVEEPEDEQKDSAASTKGIALLDRAWGMEGRNAAPEIVEQILYLCASMPAKEATKAFNKISGLRVGVTRVYEIIQGDGERLRRFVDSDPSRRVDLLDVPEGTEAFVTSLDAANVPVREPAPKRRRPTKGAGLVDEAAGEPVKQSSFKNAMVGSYSFYSSKEVSDHSGETKVVPLRLNSIYTAKMPEERFTSFKEENERVLDAVEGNLLAHGGVTKLLIMDGARSLWNHAKECGRFDDYDWIVDFYHASEHLARLAEALFDSADEGRAASRWYKKWRRKLRDEEDAVTALLRSADYYKRKKALKGARLRAWEKERGFFSRNQEMMNYAIYYAEGLPIGSGPVEAACKTIVKSRMCQSGMRWNRESGANVLNLRTLKKSDQWDQIWDQYQAEAWTLQAA